MKITIVFTKGHDGRAITFDSIQLANNYVRNLKLVQEYYPAFVLLDIYYPENLSGYIENVLDNECVDDGFYYVYNEDVEKLIKETVRDVNILLNGIIKDKIIE